MPTFDDITRLEADILARKKYHNFDPALIRKVGLQELTRQKNYKDALQSTRSRLHQAAFAYQAQEIDYKLAAQEFAALPRSLQSMETREFCRRWMGSHASSKERLPILDSFYSKIAAEIGDVHSILDCACGLNPLTMPWMPWSSGVIYDACDVFSDLAEFLQLCMDHFSVRGKAFVCDLTEETPEGQYDLVLLLKTLPCLEQLEKFSAKRLLNSLHAKNILVSYPVASLGGRQKGMIGNYTTQLEELTVDWPGEVKRFEFETELAFLLVRDSV